MFDWLKFDILEIPGDLYDMLRGWGKSHGDLKEAPPSTRKITVGIVPILKDGQVIGCFSPDLYEMAKMNYLRCQMEKNDSEAKKSERKPPYISLNKSDGTEKTAFELALLPIEWSDYNPKSKRSIRKIVEDEFYNLMKKSLALPPNESKYQISADYLRNLPQGYTVGSPRDVSLTLLNPGDKTTFQERTLHYFAQRAAFLLTIAAALVILQSTSLAWLAVLGVVIAEWCVKEFSTFELAESFIREFNSWTYGKGKQISGKKLIKTGLLIGALCLAATGIGFEAGVKIMSLAWPTATSVALTKVLTAAHFFLAGFVAFFAAAGTFVGGVSAQSFFWGLGIRYKQVDTENELSPKKALASLTERQVLSPLQTRDKLLNWQYKTLHKLGINLDDAQIARIKQHFALLANDLSVTLETNVSAPVVPVASLAQTSTPTGADIPLLAETPAGADIPLLAETPADAEAPASVSAEASAVAEAPASVIAEAPMSAVNPPSPKTASLKLGM